MNYCDLKTRLAAVNKTRRAVWVSGLEYFIKGVIQVNTLLFQIIALIMYCFSWKRFKRMGGICLTLF